MSAPEATWALWRGEGTGKRAVIEWLPRREAAARAAASNVKSRSFGFPGRYVALPEGRHPDDAETSEFMSTDEKPPEVTATVNTTVLVTTRDITFGHAWADGKHHHAIVRFGYHSGITLSSVAHAEALVTAATKARDALAELEASAPPATPEEKAEFKAWREAKNATGTPENGTAAAGEGGE